MIREYIEKIISDKQNRTLGVSITKLEKKMRKLEEYLSIEYETQPSNLLQFPRYKKYMHLTSSCDESYPEKDKE